MEVVDQWTGGRATALRQALRLTIDDFAERLGAAVRTISNWNAEPNLVPVVEMQRALDTLLFQSPNEVKARFAMILTVVDGVARTRPDELRPTGLELRLISDRHISTALEWLDRAAGWKRGSARTQLAVRLGATDSRTLQDRGHLRGQVRQHAIADALNAYYRCGAHHHEHPYPGSLARSGITTRDQ